MLLAIVALAIVIPAALALCATRRAPNGHVDRSVLAQLNARYGANRYNLDRPDYRVRAA